MQIPETEIVVSKDGVELLRKTIRPGDYVIGRGPECDVHVDVERVSRRHAQLTLNFDHALIEDLGSSNGTLVNDQPVTELTRLWPNQKIRIGDATVEIHRIKTAPPPDVSFAPQTIAVQRLLPEEFLRDKKYDIGQIIAQGGMGAILDAKDATTERRVAMKVMLDGSSPDDLVRFVAEAKVTAQLEHPSIVPVYELSVDENGQVFYTMKMVRGVTLRKVLELLAEGVAETVKKYPLSTLLTIFQKVCDALAFAHSRGVIHRDLKPENIMLDDFGVVLVMDWGLSKVVGQKPAPEAAVTRSLVRRPPPEVGDATLAGTVMGTPQYMSPEQARGEVEDLDVRSDIYALGAILYHILALRSSVSGNDAWEIVAKVSQGEIEPLQADVRKSKSKGRPVPDSLAAVVRKAMAFARDERYGSVEGLQSDVTAYQNGFATSAEKAGLGKQLSLLVKRHKGIFTTAVGAWLIITALGVWFVLNVTRAKNLAETERNRATVNERRAVDALQELRATAPTFFDQARLLTEQNRLSEALAKIDIALQLNPDESSFHRQRGNILQSMERFPEATGAYAAVLRWMPDDETAKANIVLSRMLAAAKEKDETLSLNTRTAWRDALIQQGRAAEAIIAGRGTAIDARKMLPVWQAKLDAWLGKNAPRLKVEPSGLYFLDLSNLSLSDLSPLHGMPLGSLIISGNSHLRDISPLADCPLHYLIANSIPDLVDLSPLKGKKLTKIQISKTGIRDLSPLLGMPLDGISLDNTAVSDLTPLRGVRLTHLDIWNTNVRSLEPLRGQPLEFVNMSGTPLASLDPLADAPLTHLEIGNCGHRDLAQLRTRRLQYLDAGGTILDHLEVLADMEGLEVIIIPKNLTAPGFLRKLPHLRKIDTRSAGRNETQFKDAADFWGEYDTKQATGEK